MTDIFSVNKYVKELEGVFEENKDDKNAEGMKKYMRNKFDFYGIQAAERRKLYKSFLRKENRPPHIKVNKVIINLWSKKQRELHYFAMELFEKYKNDFKLDDIKLMEYMIENNSWWDTVDFIAKKLVGTYFKKYPAKKNLYIDKWIDSNNMWLKRTAILYQLAYKEKTDEKLLFDIIIKLKDIDEFFIQKAIGWSLREYSKTSPESVEKFINSNDLSKLSRKEGLRIIKAKK